MRWPALLTVTTRDASAGGKRSRGSAVRAKCPRWSVPSRSKSKPSAVVRYGVYNTEAAASCRSGRFVRPYPAAGRLSRKPLRSPGASDPLDQAVELPPVGPRRLLDSLRESDARSAKSEYCHVVVSVAGVLVDQHANEVGQGQVSVNLRDGGEALQTRL